MRRPTTPKARRVSAQIRLARLVEMRDRLVHPTNENADVYMEDQYKNDPALLDRDILRLQNRVRICVDEEAEVS